jgi:hypothetical protein
MKPVPGLLLVAFTASVLVSSAHAESDDWYSPSAAKPPGLCCAGFVHDDVHNQTVLFGGVDGFPNFAVHGETWTLEVGGWVQRFPTNAPSPRAGAGMAFDAANGNVVLFGGNDANGVDRNDTWIWDGQNWTQVFPPTSPPARSFETNGMVYSPAGNYVMMFGGLTQSLPGPVYGTLNDTWTWDGTTWTPHAGPGPSPRRAPLARDGGGNVLLFGGDNVTGYFGDTWIWNAGANNGTGAWQQKNPPIAPSPRGLAATAWDPVRHGVILFGGSVLGTALNDTWLWKSGAWTQLTAPTVPPIRYAFGMAYDPRAGGVVMYGGYGSLYASNDLWTFESDIVPGANVTPTSLNFGEQPAGTTAYETVTVTNNGSTALTGLGISLIGSSREFGETISIPPCGLNGVLVPGASCPITVSFAPTVAGVANDTLTINFANGVAPVIVSLTGTGVAAFVTPTSLVCGNVAVGGGITGVGCGSLTVTNAAGVTLTGVEGYVSGAGFSLGPPRQGGCRLSTLAPGSSCEIDVEFVPTALGAYTGSVTIKNDQNLPVSGSPVTVTGTGTSIAASAAVISLVQGASITTDILTSSSGFAGSVVLTVSGLPFGASGSFNPITVPAGGTSALTITTSSTTPTGTYPVTVTGTSGAVRHSTVITVVITP